MSAETGAAQDTGQAMPESKPKKKKSSQVRKRLGEILVDGGLLTEEQLIQALKEQRRTSLRLGEYLVRRGILTEEQIIQTVSKQQRVDLYDPSIHKPDSSLAVHIPAAVARKYQLAPLDRSGSILLVAMRDPLDLVGLDIVMEKSRLDPEPVICSERQLQHISQLVYGQALIEDDGVFGEIDVDDDAEAEAFKDASDTTLTVDNLERIAEDAPVVRLVNSILSQAINNKASDVHLCPLKHRVQLRLRVDGVLHEIQAPPKTYFLPLVSRFKLLSGMDISVARIPQDGRFNFRIHEQDVSVRASTLPTVHGEKVVLRILEQSSGAMSLEQLDLTPDQREKLYNAMKRTTGMILATGPTGSGKTTLLYSILQQLNSPEVNIVTLEDPVEYQLDGIAQAHLNRKAGMTFASGLRSILRQDPDTIMIGEIRDMETADIAVKAAMTGHLVLSTLHTNDAAGTISRMTDMGIEPFLLSSTLLLVIAQRLVRRLCDKCAFPYPAPDDALKLMGLSNLGINFFKPMGCPDCSNTGFAGRMGIYEVLAIDEMVQNLIVRRKSSVEIRQQSVESGRLKTLAMDAAQKVLDGHTTFEEFIRVSTF